MTESDPRPDRVGLHVVLVTYRRPERLRMLLDQLAAQRPGPDSLSVIDNAPDSASRDVVASSTWCPAVEYLPAPDNLGPAGGYARGVTRVLEQAQDRDWITLIDDDVNPLVPGELAVLRQRVWECLEADAATAGVGYRGGTFSWIKARSRYQSLGAANRCAVDYLGGNGLPTYRVSALRDVGTPSSDLFFGLEELEFGLRMRAQGFSLYKVRAPETKKHTTRPGEGLGILIRQAPSWRRYYSLRNLILILRRNHHSLVAARISFTRGVAKPLVSLPFSPRYATKQLAMNVRAIGDAWRGRAGRRLDPWLGDYPGPMTEDSRGAPAATDASA